MTQAKMRTAEDWMLDFYERTGLSPRNAASYPGVMRVIADVQKEAVEATRADYASVTPDQCAAGRWLANMFKKNKCMCRFLLNDTDKCVGCVARRALGENT